MEWDENKDLKAEGRTEKRERVKREERDVSKKNKEITDERERRKKERGGKELWSG